MTARTSTSRGSDLLALLRPAVETAGYDLEQVDVSRLGRRNVVRVVVDADDGISLDDVAAVSRVISDALDDPASGDPVGPDGYTLEVTSPGVDRPLTEPRHWRRAVGRLVRTRVAGHPVEGRVLGVDDAGVALEVGGATTTVAFADLAPGAVQVEFARPAVPTTARPTVEPAL